MKVRRFESVWDAIEDSPAEAASMKARSEVTIAIREVIENWKLTQAEAAKRPGIIQPRLNEPMRERSEEFGFNALVNLAGMGPIDPCEGSPAGGLNGRAGSRHP